MNPSLSDLGSIDTEKDRPDPADMTSGMTIETLVNVLRESPPTDGLTCRFSSPAPYDRQAIEAGNDVRLPSDLLTFWSLANRATLFEDVEYGQWGLVLWSPQEVLRLDPMFQDLYSDRFAAGDLPIGRFLGDLDLVLLRSDANASDCGSVVIALPDYPRRDWFRPARSLAEFLQRFAASPAVKYWEASFS